MAIVGAVAFLAAAIAAAFRRSRRASVSVAGPTARPPDTAAQHRTEQPEMQRPTARAASDILSVAPAPGKSEVVGDKDALADGEAHLVTYWTGGPYTVEFTSKDPDGDWHRTTVDVTRIMRNPRDGGWHLHGFCHLWQKERDYDGASITTKILYKSRRWDLEDWISAVAAKEDRGS